MPTAEDVAHGYAECSAKGVCNRKTGLCECFDGYTGDACKRTTCPNDCSGHGTCEYIGDAYGAVARDDAEVQAHDLLGDLWDAKKSRMCVCDPKWTDVDCSRRMCPKGVDVLDRSWGDSATCDGNWNEDVREVTELTIDDDAFAGSFALEYQDQYGAKYRTVGINTYATGNPTLAKDVENALNSLPDETVAVTVVDASTSGSITLEITFTGEQNPGDQHLLVALVDACTDGCQPNIAGMEGATIAITSVNGEGQLYECGRRGKCDYSSGICECFSGFTDESCGTQSALA